MSFELFGPETKCDIKVGYISTDRGLVEGIGLYEANQHAKLNPGTQFIFRNRDKVQYLNINEVNKIKPDEMLPGKMSATDSCSGIVGLNLEGDSSKSVDDAFDLEIPDTGGSTQLANVKPEPDKTEVNFYGGGGVGVQAAPIIGIDGSILAVQVIHGGFGYKYPPIVDISDDTGQGAGVVAQAIIKTRTSDEDVLVEEFDAEEDYEEYDLETCAPELDKVGYGQRWGPDGKDLGKWDPAVYFNKSKDPIRYEIERYQQFLANLKEGTIIENGRIKGWWTTRQKPPLRITSADKVTREKFDVQHHAWGGLASQSTNNNNKSSSTFGVATELIESSFRVYTSGGQRRGLKFIFKSISGNHSFEIRADDYKDNASPETIKIKVKRNTKYTVTTTSKKGIRDQGLLKKGTFGTGGDIAQRTGTSNAIFSDIGKTAPDDDDLQVEAKLGTFSNDKNIIIYELKDSAAFNAEKDSKYFTGLKKKKAIKDSFMNQYAISPVAPSNVAGSDKAGKTYIFEWEEEIPWDGDYMFNIQADNEATLFIDNDIVGEKILLGKGGAAGHVLSPPTKIKKFLSAGMRKITVNLLNHQIREMKKIQKDIVATSDEVTFNISISSLFANGITIEGLDIDVSKEYGEGKDIKESHTRKVEYGRVYPVKVRSSNQRVIPAGLSSNQRELIIDGAATEPDDRRVSAGGLAYQFDNDGSDWDMNAVFRITSGNGRFEEVGGVPTIKGTGMQTIELWWNDTGGDEATGGDAAGLGKAIKTIRIGNTVWSATSTYSSNKVKLKDRTRTIDLGPAPKAGGSNSSNLQLRTKGEKVLQMEDLPGQEAGSGGVGGPGFFDDVICSVSNGRFYGISGSSCNFVVDAPVGNKGGSTGSQKGERAHVFNTVDYIKKANRKLWKINPGAGKDGDFLNQFGVLPFDPTEVAKVEKKRSKTVEVVPTGAPPSVKFEVGDDGKTYLKVIGNGRVKVGLEMDVDDEVGNRFGAAVKEVKIKADDGEIILKRTGTRYEKLSGNGTFSSGKKYLIKSLGGSQTSGSKIGVDKTVLQYDDAVQYGFDGRGYANVKVKSVSRISTTKQVEETVLGYPDYPSASTDDYAGFHEIIWNNITFPEDGNYSISTMVDDNVVLTFSSKNNKDIVLEKKGFRIRGDGRTGTGKSVEIKYFKAGTYTLKAVLEQIPGAALANGNPMALAVDIKAAFLSDEIEVISSKSWNENPMGVSMTIDAPMAPVPKEEPQQQEGRCPNNPIWTTRSNKDVDKTWYPVRVDMWSKFMNRYSISPLPPLGLKGTDGAGSVYRNSWRVELPYKGFYGVKGTVDNFGKLFIDGVEVLGPDADTKFDNPKNNAPKAKKIFLEEKTVEITVEVENDKQFIWNKIDQKVFSTADWASKQTQTEKTIEGPKNVDVAFKVSSASLYANNIDMRGVFSVGKSYGGPNFNETYNRNIEVGKVYDVVFTSNNQAQRSTNIPIVYKGLNAANNPINVSNSGRTIKLKDSDGSDANATITIDKTEGGSVRFTDDGKGFKVTGGTAAKRVLTTITLSWNDARRAGRAINSFSVADKTWSRTGSSGVVTKSVYIYPPNANNNQNNNSNIRLRNKGKGVVQMEDWTDNDWVDIMASATDGEFYNMVGNTCKFRVPPTNRTEIVYGKGLTSGSSKGGVTYDGPPLSTYASSQALGPFITPTWTTDEDYIANFNGKTWKMTWSNVDFPEDGTYDIQGEADDKLIVKLDGVQIASSEVDGGITKTQFEAPKGKRTIELTLTNLNFNAPFSQNPAVAAVKITRKVDVAKVDPRTGTALGKPWTVNPLGVSAILIPPPCPKKINGVGIVTAVIITDPGNGFPPVVTSGDGDPPAGPPVIIECPEIIPEDEGINYDDDDQVCIVNRETGEEICFTPPKGPFGEIPPFTPTIDDGGKGLPNGFRSYPDIRVKTRTGFGYVGIPLLKPVIDPIGVDPDRLIQVTDLPGLKRTGYYDGKPYYGAVFYEDGVRFAGYYDTPGQKVQIYDTMQESIDAEVTTPPSAIQRQGTDINSNDPRLNIPGTPDNLT